MKLWKLSQTKNPGYDVYDSAIVAAETADEAAAIHPRGNVHLPLAGLSWDWVSQPADVKVEYVGEAAPGTRAGVILASFNAG